MFFRIKLKKYQKFAHFFQISIFLLFLKRFILHKYLPYQGRSKLEEAKNLQNLQERRMMT